MFLTTFRRMVALSFLLSAIAYLTIKSDLTLNTVAGLAAQPEINLNPIAEPSDPERLRPVERVPRDRFGVVDPFPLDKADLCGLVYPSANEKERAAVIEGLKFFTTPHTPEEGNGPIANQQMCLGCHLNSADAFRVDRKGNRLVTTVSQVSRAGRSTPTNFDFTSLDPATGGGRAPDNDDAINNTGRTAAFTIFGDFSPIANIFNGLTQFSSNSVQHHRPTLDACLPTSLPTFEEDPNLMGGVDPETYLSSTGFRRTVGERAGPPYIGRGLMEAIFDGDILANEASQKNANNSSLDRPGYFPECPGDCIAGRHNENTSNQAFVGGDPTVRIGRFGLRAAGPTMLQFVVGGLQGELGFTSLFNPNEPVSGVNINRPGCVSPVSGLQVPVSTPVSLRALLRLTAPPEFGETLLGLLKSDDPSAPRCDGSQDELVRRGAELFGVDLVAFANRMIPGRMPRNGDSRDPNAINRADRMLNCAGCHVPVMATGRLPVESGGRHVNNVWAPIFSDLLIHQGPNINAERIAPTPRLPLIIRRIGFRDRLFDTFDLPRSLADDTLPNQGLANGREFRTAPLMGLGRIGPPFLHDGRVYLSQRSSLRHPAGTVYTNHQVTNAPLVVQTLDDAIRAAIELHDLPAPFNSPNQSSEAGGGCPVPLGNQHGKVIYRGGPADICPPYHSDASRQNRSDAREVIRRYRNLSAADQQAIIEFLKQL
ncbi:MAG TPA: di-heme oxidoredictase family protein [Blastocatellia bacterium]|nr:di-heme oxidoredictase family protein [Blastocatellia bacterium]